MNMKNVRLDYFLCESLHPSWKARLSDECEKPYWKSLVAFVQREHRNASVYPSSQDVFAAFDLCPFEDVKVVIVGQDPYHGAGQAHGLCFSVPEGVAVPPSLKNIYKELVEDCGCTIPSHGSLTNWAKQGVLLLNATLTVRAGEAGSHQRKGWEQFTNKVLEMVSKEREHVVFLLWGRYAQQKQSLIDTTKHYVLTAAHPSPFSAHNGFFGCKHFSRANEYLQQHGNAAIAWCVS
jgi:uracil-DNA glycosylase